MPVEQREQVTHITWSQRATGGTPCLDGRRQPSLGGTSRMNREVHVRICEGLGVKFPGPTRQRCRPLERWSSNAQRPSTQLEETDDGSGGHEGWTQTTRHCCLCRAGRPGLINRPCSRTGENPPYGILGRAMETSGAAMLVGVLAGESPVRGTYPVATVVISGGGAGDQFAESPEVKVLVGWGKLRSAPTGGRLPDCRPLKDIQAVPRALPKSVDAWPWAT
jgi:hypothetical protein